MGLEEEETNNTSKKNRRIIFKGLEKLRRNKQKMTIKEK